MRCIRTTPSVIPMALAVTAILGSLVGGCATHEPPDIRYVSGANVLSAVVVIDTAACAVDPPQVPIWPEPEDPSTQPTSVIWRVVESEPAEKDETHPERTVEIVAKPAQAQDPGDTARGTAIRTIFNQAASFVVPPGQSTAASGPVSNPVPPRTGKPDVLWKYAVRIPELGCDIDPGVCVKGSSGSDCDY